MATKASLLAYITTKWGDITSPKRLPTLDRDVANALVNEAYGTIVTDTHATTTVLTKSNNLFGYTITLHKAMGRVFIEAQISLLTAGGSVTNPDVADIEVGEFSPLGTSRIMGLDNSGNVRQMKITGNKISLIATFSSGNTIIFNGSYAALN